MKGRRLMIHQGMWTGLTVLLAVSILTAAETATGKLHVTVGEAGAPRLPCRVHLTVGGKSVYPRGLPRFERDRHFSCDGEFTVDVSPGRAALRQVARRTDRHLPKETPRRQRTRPA